MPRITKTQAETQANEAHREHLRAEYRRRYAETSAKDVLQAKIARENPYPHPARDVRPYRPGTVVVGNLPSGVAQGSDESFALIAAVAVAFGIDPSTGKRTPGRLSGYALREEFGEEFSGPMRKRLFASVSPARKRDGKPAGKHAEAFAAYCKREGLAAFDARDAIAPSYEREPGASTANGPVGAARIAQAKAEEERAAQAAKAAKAKAVRARAAKAKAVGAPPEHVAQAHAEGKRAKAARAAKK